MSLHSAFWALHAPTKSCRSRLQASCGAALPLLDAVLKAQIDRPIEHGDDVREAAALWWICRLRSRCSHRFTSWLWHLDPLGAASRDDRFCELPTTLTQRSAILVHAEVRVGALIGDARLTRIIGGMEECASVEARGATNSRSTVVLGNEIPMAVLIPRTVWAK